MTEPFDCPVCRGRREITLPMRRPLKVPVPPIEPNQIFVVEPGPDHKTFSCPECCPPGADHVTLLEFTNSVILEDGDYLAQHIEYVQRDIIQHLIEEALKRKLVEFKISGPPPGTKNYGFDRTEISASIGIMSKGHVATMNERIVEHQERFARNVVQEAAWQIHNWGSEYSNPDGHIAKRTAVNMLHDALANLKRRMKK